MPDTLTTSTLESLRERVRNATGADAKIDYDICVQVLKDDEWANVPFDSMALWTDDTPPPYTRSIDSCVELIGEVLPYEWLRFDIWPELFRTASILPKPTPTTAVSGIGETIPLALLEALLTALIERDKNGSS